MAVQAGGQVRDQETGVYRKDIKILHVKVLPDCSDADYEILQQKLNDLKIFGLDTQYVIVVTRHIDMNIEHMEDFVKRLEKEANAFKSPEVIDTLITSLKNIRHKKWAEEDRQREAQRAPGYVPFT